MGPLWLKPCFPKRQIWHRSEDFFVLLQQILIGLHRAKRIESRRVELRRLFKWVQRLRPECVRASVPEEPPLIDDIEQGRRVPLITIFSFRKRPAVREPLFGLMTCRA